MLFTPEILIALAAILVIAGLAHGTLGFGFPLISTPLVTLLTDIRTAVLVTVLPNIVVNLISIARGGNWRHSIGKYWPLAGWMVLGTLLGTWLLLGIPHAPLQLLLAVMIVVFLEQERLRMLDWHWIKRNPRWSGCLFGIGAGALSGAVNVSLPPLVIYFMALELAPLVLTQTLNLCFLAAKTSQAGLLAGSGIASQAALQASLPFVPLAGLAVFAGMRLQARISIKHYRALLRKALWAIALLLALQAVRELVHPTQ